MAAAFRLTPEDVLAYYAKSLGLDCPGPNLISLYNVYPAAAFLGKASDNYSSGQAIETLEDLAARELPAGVSYEWTGMSLQEKIAGNSVYYIFALSILLVFFMLAGQYESWITPLAVILAVPMALLGTVTALLGLGVPNNIYVQIGLVLLIALSAKNAILVVEMARENRASGKSIVDSAVDAAALRFRPIVMTSLTFRSAALSRHRLLDLLLANFLQLFVLRGRKNLLHLRCAFAVDGPQLLQLLEPGERGIVLDRLDLRDLDFQNRQELDFLLRCEFQLLRQRLQLRRGVAGLSRCGRRHGEQ
jgi:hypothetical protein